MNLEKAIEIKEEYRDNQYLHLGSKIAEADNLSIEALKRIYLQRQHPRRKLGSLLVGETEE